jgi:hypothetical protein
MWFDASDVSPDAKLAGRIAFLMTEMSAGVPGRSDFMHSEIVGEPLLAILPKRLLGHPNGGVLAVVGHVDVLWSWSFVGLAKTSDAEIYTSILCRLMEGHTVASATEPLVQRYVILATRLAEQVRAGDSLAMQIDDVSGAIANLREALKQRDSSRIKISCGPVKVWSPSSRIYAAALATSTLTDERAADAETMLSSVEKEAIGRLERLLTKARKTQQDLAMATLDARNYIVIGDPAVRLNLGGAGPEESVR